MNKLKTYFSKWFLIIFTVVLLSLIFLFLWGFQVFSIDGTQTCFTHHFYAENKSFTQSQQKIKNLLKQENFREISEGEKYQKWTDGVTYIALNGDSDEKKENEKHRDLTVCTADKKSKDWQQLAMQLDNMLAEDIKTIYRQVQLDPAVFGISKDSYYNGFTGVVHIDQPVTVEKLSNVEKDCREKLKEIQKKGNYTLSCNSN
jgi:cell division protein FtsL